MSGGPEFSPRMLRLFLQARVLHAAEGLAHGARADALRAAKAAIRRRAKVTHFEFNFAWRGLLGDAATRARLWAALGIVPAEHGVTLVDGGGQRPAVGDDVDGEVRP